MDETLLGLIIGRLDSAPVGVDGAESLILAACEGEDALERALGGEMIDRRALVERRPVDKAGVWLQRVDVAGFRGIGSTASLAVAPNPGLTLVIGRNGSGKSSFAEALEFLMTGTNFRWKERSRIWSQGWQNLHQPDSSISARLVKDGQAEPLAITATWPPNGELVDADRQVTSPSRQSLDELSWGDPLQSYRPFLSHTELGSLLDDGPTKLYDALASILGLEDLTIAQKMLADARLARASALKDVAGELPALLERLAVTDDKRAIVSRKALSGKKWELDVVDLALAGLLDEGDVEAELNALRLLCTLAGPEPVRVEDSVSQLRLADQKLRQTANTDSGRAKRAAKLLKDALTYHKHSGDVDCPVCHRTRALNTEWRDAAEKELKELLAAAGEAEEAELAAKEALRGMRGLLAAIPPVLDRASDVGLDARDVKQAWADFVGIPADEDLSGIAHHLEKRSGMLTAALGRLREAAAKELEQREDAWRPIAHDLTSWVSLARPALELQAAVPTLKAAEKWIKEATAAIRDERFAPIADGVEANWRMLRQDSNVTLERLKLEGAGTWRRLALDIDVDGQPGAALAVMSQGELNCLALSLFLPRATLADSPFRFVVIDDPVQSMDPAKVDGLARVLDAAAKSRQVIVFTHDDRLPQAIWRLEIPATILEVARKEHSVVEVRQIRDVVSRYLDDAWAVASDDHLPLKASRVVPGFCRSALEEACAQVILRRRLAAGRRHDDVERELEGVSTVTMWMALAVFNDIERGGDVMKMLNERLGPAAGNTFSRLKKGAHEPDAGDLKQLVKYTESLTRFVGEMR